ncbi:hypothetical protein [Frisingicoccus sp.]
MMDTVLFAMLWNDIFQSFFQLSMGACGCEKPGGQNMVYAE